MEPESISFHTVSSTYLQEFSAVEIRPSRRDVLKSGVLAGAGLATGFSPMALMRALATGGSTCGQLTDIEHVIILIQENRSFDHYFGRYKGVRGFDDQSIDRAVFAQGYLRSDEPMTVPDPLFPYHIDTTLSVPPKPGECTNDIDHQWVGQQQR